MTMISVLLLSCTEKQPESVIAEAEPLPFEFDGNLQDIDTLLQHDAANALQKLLSFDTQSAIFNENYHKLLLAESLFKTDNPQYYRIELQAAMQYFDSLAEIYPKNDDITLLSARSHYMNGVGYYENDSVVEACKEYLHTLEIMENHFDVEKVRGYKAKFMALTYNRLSTLFSDQIMMEPTIYCDKKALFYCKIAPTSKYGVAKTTNLLGMHFDMSNEPDSAYFYYRQALEALPDSNNVVYRDIITHIATLSYCSFGASADESINTLKDIASQTNDESEKSSRFLSIGYIYYNEGSDNDALFYLNTVYDNTSNVEAKLISAEFLRNIYQKCGDTVKSNVYAQFLADNTISQFDKMKQVSTLANLFNDYLEGQKSDPNDNNKHFKNSVFIWFILSLIIILVLVTALSVRRTNKIKNSVKNPFSKEPICKHILGIVNEHHFKSKVDFRNYREFALSKEQLLALRDAADRHYDGFTQRLQKEYPELTYDDIDYCCLYLLGVKDADISALMQKDYSTVCYRRRKINSISNMDKILVSDCNTTI